MSMPAAIAAVGISRQLIAPWRFVGISRHMYRTLLLSQYLDSSSNLC
jgi:hypothetical protein